jgi:hypothetical protein
MALTLGEAHWDIADVPTKRFKTVNMGMQYYGSIAGERLSNPRS